jgi:hypothetical protein
LAADVTENKAHALPFDRVVLLEGGERRPMRLEDFLAIPLPDKIRHILARTVEFYAGRTPVDRRIALAALRESMRE